MAKLKIEEKVAREFYYKGDWGGLAVYLMPMVKSVVNDRNYRYLTWNNEDLAQACLVKIIKYIPNFKLDERGNLLSIIYKLCLNTIQVPGRPHHHSTHTEQLILQDETDYENVVNFTEAIIEPFDSIDTKLEAMNIMDFVINSDLFFEREKALAKKILDELKADTLDFTTGHEYMKQQLIDDISITTWKHMISKIKKELYQCQSINTSAIPVDSKRKS